MGKQMITSFMICLLIPTCIGVYGLLYQNLQEGGYLAKTGSDQEKSEVLELDESMLENMEELVKEQDDDDLIEVIQETNEMILGHSTVHEWEDGEPMDHIDDAVVEIEMMQLDQNVQDEGVNVLFVTKDEDGNIIDERYETLDHSQVIQPNSDRHLELLALEFVRMHFDFEIQESLSVSLIGRDDRYAKVAVTKTDWSTLTQEKFNVVLETGDGQPRPISMQKVEIKESSAYFQ
ncbi:hypothetical protein GN156_05500 [bacterium LRH843]|nr:hypothetical protein [bacterium LRH843]